MHKKNYTIGKEGVFIYPLIHEIQYLHPTINKNSNNMTHFNPMRIFLKEIKKV